MINTINLSDVASQHVTLRMARLDQQHTLASGNKFYKLVLQFEYARQKGIKRLVSFGGAFSNHIHALALYGANQGFETIGIIRGEPEYVTNPTLEDAQRAGMRLLFVNREEYRQRFDDDYITEIQRRFPDSLIIPEGGATQLAVLGCAHLMEEINSYHHSDIICVACGTGSTLAGLVCGLTANQRAIGYAALRDKSLDMRVRNLMRRSSFASDSPGSFGYSEPQNYRIEAADYGGFAKLDIEVLEFVLDWLEQTGILLDPVYTSKMCYRLMQQIQAGEFAAGASICMVHSGGLQGWRGMRQRVIRLAGKQAWNRISAALAVSVSGFSSTNT